MMRKASVACALMALSACSARAEAGPQHMEAELLNVGYTTTFSAEWILTMPVVAEDCGMKVVKAQLQNVASRFRQLDTVMFVVQRLPRSDNAMLKDWKVMLGNDKLRACQYAETKWGEDGDMFPGVLRKL